MIKTLEWTDDGVVMVDQRLLPSTESYPLFRSYQEVAQAITDMVVRGAPAIGVAAAMGIARGVLDSPAVTVEELEQDFERVCDVIGGTRPTAVNLFWAIKRMRRKFGELKATRPATGEIKRALRDEAIAIGEEDIEINRRMGRFGASLIPQTAKVLTHCNAGALATAGYGTALGCIRGAIEAGKRVSVFADETRPFLQGARLTAWELQKDSIPVTLITDNMAGYIMRKERIDCVIVGADRIASNGDVANKIGTYMVAVLAKENGIPFYVAAPLSTIDLSLSSGDAIPIERRKDIEVTHLAGQRIAPEGVAVDNPAFDVTPNQYVSAIITERGIARAPFADSLQKLFRETGNTIA